MRARNPALIRLVASQYRELQGLKTMADAMIPIAFGVLLRVARSPWDLLFVIPIAAAWAWFRVTWIRDRIEAFYDDRCGRIGWRPVPWTHTFLFMQAVSLGSTSTLMAWPPGARRPWRPSASRPDTARRCRWRACRERGRWMNRTAASTFWPAP
jgi:hypothetical protein